MLLLLSLLLELLVAIKVDGIYKSDGKQRTVVSWNDPFPKYDSSLRSPYGARSRSRSRVF